MVGRKLTKRLDDVIQESSALKSHLVQQLKTLSNAVPELVNFGISVSIFAPLSEEDYLFV